MKNLSMSVVGSARQQWFANPRRDLLAGTVVALALILEAIAFSNHHLFEFSLGPTADAPWAWSIRRDGVAAASSGSRLRAEK